MNPGRLTQRSGRAKLTRRGLLAAAAAAGGGLALAACGGAVATSQTSAPTARAAATPAPATAATATSTPVAAAPVATVKVVAKDFTFEIDKLVVPAGTVRFTFQNAGKMTHDFWVYPPQDLTAYLAKKRAGEKVKGAEYLKGATELFDLEAGKSGEKDHPLRPGYYEVACFVQAKEPDGTTSVHIDKGQVQWLTVTGPGFPAVATTPANTIALEMNGDEAGAWLFTPDKLVVPAGDVTFTVTNKMKAVHDLKVHPLLDTSAFVTKKLKGVKDYDSIKAIGLIHDLPTGKTETVTTKLTPGVWVAACYILSKDAAGNGFLHSDRGQRFVFTVK